MNELKASIWKMSFASDRVFKVLESDSPVFPPLEEIVHVAQRMEEEAGRSYAEVPDLFLRKGILRKLKQGEPLSKKEKRNLPFILYEEDCDEAVFRQAVASIDFHRGTQVARLVYVFLS